MLRREYFISPIVINGLSYSRVIVDPHYELKHSAYVTDGLILELVRQLNGVDQLAEAQDQECAYYVRLMFYQSKCYRLIWLLHYQDRYIGIINVFRDRKGRKK